MFASTNNYEIREVPAIDVLGGVNASPGYLTEADKTAIMNHLREEELAQAYEDLSLYDQYGEDALKEGMGGGDDMFDIIQSFYAGNHLGGGGISMVQDVVLPVSLEDLYKGVSQKLSFNRNVICSMCKGTGKTMYKERCQQCKGVMLVKEKKEVEVHIEKGMQNGQMITLLGEHFNIGDTVVIIEQKEHPKFKRKGDDLFVEHSLSLKEALCGFEFVLTHLDNRQLIIKSQPGEVVKPGQVKEINDEGMPIYQKPFMRGKLYIHFTVEFPGSLTPDQSKAIEAVLPSTSSPQLTDMEVAEA